MVIRMLAQTDLFVNFVSRIKLSVVIRSTWLVTRLCWSTYFDNQAGFRFFDWIKNSGKKEVVHSCIECY